MYYSGPHEILLNSLSGNPVEPRRCKYGCGFDYPFKPGCPNNMIPLQQQNYEERPQPPVINNGMSRHQILIPRPPGLTTSGSTPSETLPVDESGDKLTILRKNTLKQHHFSMSVINALFKRPSVVNNFFELSDTPGGVLVTAPPYSGKSSLILLCGKKLDYKCFLISLNEANCKETNSVEENFALIDKLCMKLYDMDLKTILHSEYYVLLDSCQTLYFFAQFWLLIKNKSHVIAAASFGERFSPTDLLSATSLTPSCFAYYLRGDDITLSYKDYPNLVTFVQKNEVDECYFKTSIYYDMLFNYCMTLNVPLNLINEENKRAHIGLIFTLLKCFFVAFGKINLKLPHQHVFEYFVGEGFINNIIGLRCVYSINELDASLGHNSNVLNLLYDLVRGKRIPFDISNLLHLQLYKLGILICVYFDTVPYLLFSSRIICSYYGKQCIVGLSSSAVRSVDFNIEPNDIFESHTKLIYFVKQVIRRFSKESLLTSYSYGATNGNKLVFKEALFQHQFFINAYAILPKIFSVSPEVGYCFGVKGSLDFYINNKLKWAIELLRNSNKLIDHFDRLHPDGRYAEILKICNSYLVVDFCMEEYFNSRNDDNRYLKVCFNSDITQFTFYHLDSTDGPYNLNY